MATPLKLKCRCGWVGNFDTSQLGIELACPDCQRGIYITDDPAEFANRNVGSQEFAFADDDPLIDEGVSEEPVEAAPPPSRRRRAPGKVGSAARTRTKRGKTMSAIKGAPDLQQRIRPGSVMERESSNIGPVILIVIGVVVVAGGAWFFLHQQQQEASLSEVRAVASRVMSRVVDRKFVAVAENFSNPAELERLENGLESLFAAGPATMKFFEDDEMAGLLATPSSFGSSYHIYGQDRGYRVRLDMVYENGKWKVGKIDLRRLTAAEWSP